MAFSSILLCCLLVALSAAALLPAEDPDPTSRPAVQDHGVDEPTPDSTWEDGTAVPATPQHLDGADSTPDSTWGNGTAVPGTPHWGQLPHSSETPGTGKVNVTSAAAAQPVDVISGATTPVELACPRENPDRYTSTGWYVLKGTSHRGLYRSNMRGEVYKYSKEGRPDTNVRLNLTDPYTITIYDDACNHTEVYQCMRFARVGFRNEAYTFHVDNWTVIKEYTEETAVTLGNAAPHQISTPGLVIAAGAVVHFITSY